MYMDGWYSIYFMYVWMDGIVYIFMGGWMVLYILFVYEWMDDILYHILCV